MAQVDFTPAPTFRTAAPKARMTVYFAMLIIALLAMIVACIFMFLEVKNFGGFGAVKGKWTSVEHRAPTMIAASQQDLGCHALVANAA